MIELIGIKKNYGNTEALKGISFSLGSGEVVGLLGHNGAGKTTTLRIIAKLLDPTEGTIKHPADFRSQLGYFPDDPFLFQYLTGREMLYFMASLYRMDHARIQSATADFLRLFELEKYADQLIATYSRGMKRKISLIGSLLHDPCYWLLDEPTEALDPVAICHLKELIERRKCAPGSVLISTHQLSLAESICDRLIILNHGILQFNDIPGEGQVPLEDLYLSLHQRA